MLGGGVGESATKFAGLRVEGDYNVITNTPPLYDRLGSEGLCYRVGGSASRNFSTVINDPNILTVSSNDLVFYSLGKWAKIDQSFVDTLSGYTTEIELYAAISALKNTLVSDPAFNGNRITTRIGFPAISPGGKTVTQVLENLFYPAVAPQAYISGGENREFGANPSLTLNWTAIKQTNPITSILVAGLTIVPTGDSQNGTLNVSCIQNVDTNFSITVFAGNLSTVASTTIYWYLSRYWGISQKDGILNVITDADLLLLSNELASSRSQSRTMNGLGNYFVFAWPTTFGTPTFIVNGFSNNAWTKVRSNSPFINAHGYKLNIDVWVTNKIQAGSTFIQVS